ncbi:mitochondrial membrane protein [Basidiobolus ranarum]|uniref:Mitochondrial fission 1 protein n=1 Tax=Basidiobolus ranarum TaxID=34480 RepID=A0ABR2VRI5_9FUNG
MTKLPTLLDAQVSLSTAELNLLRKQYEQDLESVDKKFNYAWGLLKSRNQAQQHEGIRLFGEVYQADSSRRIECLYYLSMGYYKKGNHSDARKFVQTLLSIQPNNLLGQRLSEAIDKQVTKGKFLEMRRICTLSTSIQSRREISRGYYWHWNCWSGCRYGWGNSHLSPT